MEHKGCCRNQLRKVRGRTRCSRCFPQENFCDTHTMCMMPHLFCHYMNLLDIGDMYYLTYIFLCYNDNLKLHSVVLQQYCL